MLVCLAWSSNFLVFSLIFIFTVYFTLCVFNPTIEFSFCFLNPLVFIEFFVCFMKQTNIYLRMLVIVSFTKFLSMRSIYFLQDAFY